MAKFASNLSIGAFPKMIFQVYWSLIKSTQNARKYLLRIWGSIQFMFFSFSTSNKSTIAFPFMMRLSFICRFWLRSADGTMNIKIPHADCTFTVFAIFCFDLIVGLHQAIYYNRHHEFKLLIFGPCL